MTIIFKFNVGDMVFSIWKAYERCPHCGQLADSGKWRALPACKITGSSQYLDTSSFMNGPKGVSYDLDRHEIPYRVEAEMVFATEAEARAECDKRNRAGGV